MKTLVIIDADSLIYQSSKESLVESIEIIDEKIRNIFTQTSADYYSMFISMGVYYRHKVSSLYKSNRKKYHSPLRWTKTLKNYLIEKYGAIAGRDVEADDLCTYFYNQFYIIDRSQSISNFPQGEEMDALENEIEERLVILERIPELPYEPEVRVILASPDKDLLQNIPGVHFNYTYKLLDKENPDSLIRGEWITTSEEDAGNFIWKQMITGDASDGIAGLPGKGEAFARKLYNNISLSRPVLCFNAYLEHYENDVTQALMRFQENYRMLHILENDSDFIREVGYIPELIYHKVETENQEIIIPQDEEIEF